MAAAIDLATNVVKKEKKRNVVVILITDGYPDNMGLTLRAAKRFNLVRNQVFKQLHFFAMGIGKDYDKALLQDIAMKTNNNENALKVEDTHLCDFLIEDQDLSKDWSAIMREISCVTEK